MAAMKRRDIRVYGQIARAPRLTALGAALSALAVALSAGAILVVVRTL